MAEEPAYMLCTECGNHYPVKTGKYCPQDGHPLVLVGEAKNPFIRKEYDEINYQKSRFGLLRVLAVLAELIGWLSILAAFFLLAMASEVSYTSRYTDSSFIAALASFGVIGTITLFFNLLFVGISMVIGGEYIKMQFNVHDHLVELTGLNRIIAGQTISTEKVDKAN